MVEIVREQTLFRKIALFVEVLITLQKNVLKGSERKGGNLVRLVIWTTNVWNARLANVLDADLKIILLKNVQIHLKRIINSKSKYVLVKRVIVHSRKNATTAKITTTKRYMHLCHLYLIMMNVLVGIFVTVCN